MVTSTLAKGVGASVIFGAAIVGSFRFLPWASPALVYSVIASATTTVVTALSSPVTDLNLPPPVTHVAVPRHVRALYMTSWIAGSKNLRANIVQLLDETEANAIVIDVKDYTGRISFPVTDPLLVKTGSFENRIPDLRDFIRTLHEKNVYVIARISAFQDRYLSDARPDLAVRRASDDGVWRDHKGISWLDVGATEVWDYLIAIGQEAYANGFDELNFDYIRFPSDGNMKDISYRFYDAKHTTKPEQMRQFFEYLHGGLASTTGAVLSADLFGMTTSNTDDLGIGQVLENAIPYFDYIAPMVYPSHYPAGFNGYKSPAAVPYDIIKYAMGKGRERLIAASSTPDKLRPWLQDFNLGAVYTADMVRQQKTALYELGLDSWMMWSPSNRYTKDALDREENQ